MKSKRIIMSLLGVVITAISIGAFKFAEFGVDPFQSFMSGMDALIPIDFGTLYVIINTVLILFSFLFDRHYIGIATLMNLFLLGYVADFALGLLISLIPEPTCFVRVAFFLFGFLFLCLGSSLYMSTDLGVSTYDAIALIFTNKWRQGKFKAMRICTDITCVGLGISTYLISGGPANGISSFIGIGTIFTAFCMGPLSDLFNKKISKPLLQSKGNIGIPA